MEREKVSRFDCRIVGEKAEMILMNFEGKTIGSVVGDDHEEVPSINMSE